MEKAYVTVRGWCDDDLAVARARQVTCFTTLPELDISRAAGEKLQ